MIQILIRNLFFLFISLTPVFAENPSLELNGQFYAAICSHKDNINEYRKNYLLDRGKFDFDIKGQCRSLYNIKYELLLGLNIIGNSYRFSYFRKINLKLTGKGGVLSIGNKLGPEYSMFNAIDVLRNKNGINIISFPRNIILYCNSTLSANSMGSANNSVKVVYFTPKFIGFRFGLGFTPQERSRFNMFNKENISGLLSYDYLYKNIFFGLSCSGVASLSEGSFVNFNIRKLKDENNDEVYITNARSWSIGGQISYNGFELGAQYINNGNSHIVRIFPEIMKKLYREEHSNAGRMLNLASRYTLGKHSIALGYYFNHKDVGFKKIKSNRFFEDNFYYLYNKLDLLVNKYESVEDVCSVIYDFNITNDVICFLETNFFSIETTRGIKHCNRMIESTILDQSGCSFSFGSIMKF